MLPSPALASRAPLCRRLTDCCAARMGRAKATDRVITTLLSHSISPIPQAAALSQFPMHKAGWSYKGPSPPMRTFFATPIRVVAAATQPAAALTLALRPIIPLNLSCGAIGRTLHKARQWSAFSAVTRPSRSSHRVSGWRPSRGSRTGSAARWPCGRGFCPRVSQPALCIGN